MAGVEQEAEAMDNILKLKRVMWCEGLIDMAYYFEKMSYIGGEWFAHLLLSSKEDVLRLPIESAKGQTDAAGYLVITSRHQIDSCGKLFVARDLNHRQREAALVGERYATQYDFDKFCFENPNEAALGGFDWNAEVYKAFESSVPGVYTSASRSESP